VACSYYAEGLAKDEDEDLVGDGDWVREEEKGESDVEERQRGQDGLCRDERHDGRFGSGVELEAVCRVQLFGDVFDVVLRKHSGLSKGRRRWRAACRV